MLFYNFLRFYDINDRKKFSNDKKNINDEKNKFNDKKNTNDKKNKFNDKKNTNDKKNIFNDEKNICHSIVQNAHQNLKVFKYKNL